MNIDKVSHPDLFDIPSTHLCLTKEKFKIPDKSFQTILTIEMIKNNEHKKLSRHRKRRFERKIKIDDRMKSI